MEGKGAMFPTKQVLVLTVTNFGQAVMMTLPFTLAVFMVRGFEAVRGDTDEQRIGRLTGILAGVFSFAQFLTSYAWGVYSNRRGRRPIMMCGTASSCVALVWFGLAGSYRSAAAARVFGGLFNGIIGAWKCMVGESEDMRTPHVQGRIMGYMSLAWGIGSVTGPAIGGLLSRPCDAHPHAPLCGDGQLLSARPYLLPCLAAALLNLGAFAMNVVCLEETLPAARRRAAKAARAAAAAAAAGGQQAKQGRQGQHWARRAFGRLRGQQHGYERLQSFSQLSQLAPSSQAAGHELSLLTVRTDDAELQLLRAEAGMAVCYSDHPAPSPHQPAAQPPWQDKQQQQQQQKELQQLLAVGKGTGSSVHTLANGGGDGDGCAGVRGSARVESPWLLGSFQKGSGELREQLQQQEQAWQLQLAQMQPTCQHEHQHQKEEEREQQQQQEERPPQHGMCDIARDSMEVQLMKWSTPHASFRTADVSMQPCLLESSPHAMRRPADASMGAFTPTPPSALALPEAAATGPAAADAAGPASPTAATPALAATPAPAASLALAAPGAAGVPSYSTSHACESPGRRSCDQQAYPGLASPKSTNTQHTASTIPTSAGGGHFKGPTASAALAGHDVDADCRVTIGAAADQKAGSYPEPSPTPTAEKLPPWYNDEQVVLAVLSYGAVALLFCALDELLPIYASAPRAEGGLAMGEREFAAPLMFNGATLIVFSVWGYPWLQQVWGTLPLARIGLLLAILVCMLLPACSLLMGAHASLGLVLLYVCMFIKSPAACSAFTGSIILVNVVTPREQLGAVNGAGQTLASFVRGVGPAAAGILWGVFLKTALPGAQFLSFAVVASTALGAWVLYAFLRSKDSKVEGGASHAGCE